MKEYSRSRSGISQSSRKAARPRVTLSYAQTLDGRIATRSGSSRWISSPESLLFAHEMRAGNDAILIGAGTACLDNPSLTVRHVTGDDPLRVIVDSSLRTPLTSAVFANGTAGNTLVATTESAPENRCARARNLGAKVVRFPRDGEGRVALKAVFDELGELGVSSVMVEGGSSLITSLLRERLVDGLAVCVAPKILGKGVEAIGELGIRNLDDAVSIVNVTLQQYGPDMVISGDLRYRYGDCGGDGGDRDGGG